MPIRPQKDRIVYEVEPKFLKHPTNGRVFPASPILIARGDMEAVDDPNPPKKKAEEVGTDEIPSLAKPLPAKGWFDVSKANKPTIVAKIKEDYGVDIDVSASRKDLIAQFKELKANAGNNTDSPVSE